MAKVLRRIRQSVFGGRNRGARPWRPAWLPDGMDLVSEAVAHPHTPSERGELFLAFNTGTTEIEVLNWLHATICLLKPTSILETGAHDGLGTIALADACRANGFGTVHSLEIDEARCADARHRLARRGLDRFAEVHAVDSLRFLETTDLHFDLGFFDSLCEIRAEEYVRCRRRGILHGPAVFHDTSPERTETMKEWPSPDLHAAYRRKLLDLAGDGSHGGFFESTLSRGLFVLFPRPEPPVRLH